MESSSSSRRIRNPRENKALTVVEFIETYNSSSKEKPDTPLPTQDLDRLYQRISVTMKEQCKLKQVPEFEINIFGKITKLHGGYII